MNIGAKASAAVVKSGLSIVYLHNLYTKSEAGDSGAQYEIARLIRCHSGLEIVFYSFRTAARRVNDATRTVKRLKLKTSSASDPRNGSWGRLKAKVGTKRSSKIPVAGGLPGLGRGSR